MPSAAKFVYVVDSGRGGPEGEGGVCQLYHGALVCLVSLESGRIEDGVQIAEGSCVLSVEECAAVI